MTLLDFDLRLDRPGFAFAAPIRRDLSGLAAVFGASGAGKTTFLRLIAGFERGAGHLRFGSTDWQTGRSVIPPHRRRIATVFQDARLFPHLDVAGNLDYAARRGGTVGQIAGIADRFGVTPLLKRPVAGLSGGEAQRVALARALLTDPVLILMDEPLSSLDAVARAAILPLIEDLRDEGRAPILYVSHSRAEVARLAGQVLLFAGGRLVAAGPTEKVLPQAAAAPGEDEVSVLTVRLGPPASGDGLRRLTFPGGVLMAPDIPGAEGRQTRIAVRARDVMLATGPADSLAPRISALNILAARVTAVDIQGASARISLDCGGTILIAGITARSAQALALQPGAECLALIKSVALLGD